MYRIKGENVRSLEKKVKQERYFARSDSNLLR